MAGDDAEDWVTDQWHEASSDPEAVAPNVDRLADHLDGDSAHFAAHALQLVAEAEPDAVEPVVPELIDRIRAVSGALSATHTIEALAAVAEEYPDAVTRAVPILATAVRNGENERRALEALLAVARGRPEAVADAVDALALAVADDDDRGKRELAAETLRLVAAADPDAVAPATDALIERLRFEYDDIRADAARALGHVGDPRGLEEVKRLLDDDEPAVRAAATDALAAAEDGDGGGAGGEGPPETVPAADPLSVRYEAIEPTATVAEDERRSVSEARVDGEVVALVELGGERTIDRSAVGEFLEAVEIWSKLDDHDHVVSVRDWGDDPLPWVAVEHMELGSLADRSGMSPDERLWVASSVADAFGHAHRYGVYHLDFSPSDLLFTGTPGDSWPAPKVSGWRLAAVLADGTEPDPRYAAPEQARDEAGDDITDIYRVGAVLYELFTGEPPFSDRDGVLDEPAPRPTDIDPSLPGELDEVLGRALATDREDRYETVVDLRRDLDALR